MLVLHEVLHFKKMIFVFLLLSGVIAQITSLGLIEQPPLQCSQNGLPCIVKVGRPNCSVEDWVKPRTETPSLYPTVEATMKCKADEKNQTVPVLSLTLTQPSDATIYSLKVMKVHVHEFNTNNSLCVCYIFGNNISWSNFKPWSFILDQIVIEPGMTYQISVYNLPKPNVGGRVEMLSRKVPGCEYPEYQSLRVCYENGHRWNPNMTWSVTSEENGIWIELIFNTAQFSDMYKVYVRSADFQTDLSHTVARDNHTSIRVNFSLKPSQLKCCEFFLGIQPFFKRCMEKCSHHRQKVDICSFFRPKMQRMVWTLFGQAGLLFCVFTALLLHNKLRASYKDPSSASHQTMDKGTVVTVPVQERSKVLIIYSQDHPMYTKIVLKLCAFLRAKCGTEVTLDLLDSTCLSTVGSIQWLDMQRKRLTGTSDKILVLCSPGISAKWNAMCEGRRVMTREDVCSPMGDMLTPALNLIIPEFVRASSFGKYAVAYFSDVCSEKDVPSLFHMAVKYQLMKQFDELFFRLLNEEKYEPGRIKHIHGLGRNDYDTCPSGRGLKDAIQAFQAYQLKNPNWFEMELVDVNEEFEENEHEKEGVIENPCYRILQNELQIKGNLSYCTCKPCQWSNVQRQSRYSCSDTIPCLNN